MYTINLYLIPPICISLLIFITWLLKMIPAKYRRWLTGILAMLSVILIFKFTVIGRTPSLTHRFTFFAPYSNEFYREMIMNALLYFPLGLSLSYVIKSFKYSILIAFILSLFIESWQYLAGTGLAQGTDVIMNTLGVVIGGLSYLWTVRH